MNNKKLELPIVEPPYSTYHCQGIGGAIVHSNPSVRNWYLSHCIILCCNSSFIYRELLSPVVGIMDSEYWFNPDLEIITTPFKEINCDIVEFICEYLEKEYYVVLEGIDDFYVQGKTHYNKKHMQHDGLICGYDNNEKTFSMYAYDSDWEYRIFSTPQKCIQESINSDFVKDYPGRIKAIKVKPVNEPLNVDEILLCLKWYVGATLEQYPPYKIYGVYGIVVYDYIAIYLKMLLLGVFKYEQTDNRIFRMIWEHKKVVLEAITATETKLGLDNTYSELYAPIVNQSDKMRTIYAMHLMKRQDSKLETLYNMIFDLKDKEQEVLKSFISCLENRLNNNEA